MFVNTFKSAFSGGFNRGQVLGRNFIQKSRGFLKSGLLGLQRVNEISQRVSAGSKQLKQLGDVVLPNDYKQQSKEFFDGVDQVSQGVSGLTYKLYKAGNELAS